MKTQRGMALVTVLLIIALMTIAAVAAQRQWITALKNADTQQFQRQAQWTLRGAEAWLLKQDSSVKDNQTQQLQLDDWRIHYRWRDRQHCFNLSTLGQPGRTDEKGLFHLTAAQKVFARLLMQQGVAQNDAAGMVQQLQTQLNPNGGKQWPVLSDKSELRTSSVFTPSRWAALAPMLCALPERKLSINLNALSTADAPLLVALLDDNIDLTRATELIKQRPERGWLSLDAFFADVSDDYRSAVATIQSVAVTESRYWELQLWLTDSYHFAAQRSQLVRDRQGFIIQHRQFGLNEAP
ncbi:type II secretion system minor pseudopilin GspK [Enterobacter mori]